MSIEIFNMTHIDKSFFLVRLIISSGFECAPRVDFRQPENSPPPIWRLIRPCRKDGPLDTRGGGAMVFFKFVQQIVKKKLVLTTHEKKKKVQQTDGMFHAQGGRIILF